MALTDEEIEDEIETALASPQSASADGISTSMPNVKDMIEAAKFLESRRAARSGTVGIKIMQVTGTGSA